MKVLLKCTYSGDPEKHGEPGDVIDVDKAEGKRLVDLGAAILPPEAKAEKVAASEPAAAPAPAAKA